MLEADVYESTDGSFQLRWEADEAVRLVESRTEDFAASRTLYAGADTARVISGKVDGQWYYRLEADSGSRVVGEPIVVTVRHHPLGRAFAFFTLGAVVFVATLGLIVFGSRDRNERR